MRFASSLLRTGLLLLAVLPPSFAQVEPEQQEAEVVAAAPGRIEGSADSIEMGASTSGIVDEVPVRQGDEISVGQLLLRLRCDDVTARLGQRQAEHEAASARHRMLANGARSQEIDIARAELGVAETRLEEARARLSRMQTLVEGDNVSRAARDTAERESRMSEAELTAARSRLRLLEAGTREEELGEAEAQMTAAKYVLEIAQAELEKCEVRSPIDGIVLRRHVSEGELVSLAFPRPLLTIAELDHYRVRAEVDEHDVPAVIQGQEVEVVINAAEPRRLRGRVSSIAPVMGRRQILTTDPADKSDRDVLEVLIDVDGEPANLPIGLRVSVLFFERHGGADDEDGKGDGDTEAARR